MPRKATKKTAKKSASAINPGAIGVIARSAVGEGLDAVWRVGTALFVVALLIAWVTGRGPLQRAAAGGYDMPRVEFVSPGALQPADFGVPDIILADQIVDGAVRLLETEPFDRSELVALRAWLETEGWFEEITQVRRMPGNVVRVECVWRSPRAMVVPRRGAPVLVGSDSAPMRVGSDLNVSGLVRILNPLEGVPTTDSGQMAFGRSWGLSDVSDAIALLDLLAERGLERTFVDSIDVRDPSAMLITTTNGARIIWGGPVDAPSPGEASVDTRLGVIAAAFQDPRINRSGQILDARIGEIVRDIRPVR